MSTSFLKGTSSSGTASRSVGRRRAGVLKNLELLPREPLAEALVSREALIDAVIPDVAGSKLQALGMTVLAKDTPRQRLEAFVYGMIEMQRDDPGLNAAILRRYPDAVALLGV